MAIAGNSSQRNSRIFQARQFQAIAGKAIRYKKIPDNSRQRSYAQFQRTQFLSRSYHACPRQLDILNQYNFRQSQARKFQANILKAILIKATLNKETLENTRQCDSRQGNFRQFQARQFQARKLQKIIGKAISGKKNFKQFQARQFLAR